MNRDAAGNLEKRVRPQVGNVRRFVFALPHRVELAAGLLVGTALLVILLHQVGGERDSSSPPLGPMLGRWV
ncbi:MAG: hypothetical protein DWQ37_06445 [Planctomycetota bacterium]|nr:MAG: hypothetical protein DWQ37_06445 [Planctomycetota bacterium]